MKEIINYNKVFLMVLSIIVILISMTTVVFSNSPTIIDSNSLGFGDFETLEDQLGNTGGNTPNNTSNNTVNNIGNNTVNNTSNNTTNNTSNNAINNKVNNTKLPQTGIEDYSVGIMIIICIASAIYAYKKVRDYNSI